MGVEYSEASVLEALVWGKESQHVESGYWGTVTGIDWCEPNYKVLPFMAEFWNTVSNAGFLLTGALCLRQCYAESLPAKFHWLAATIFFTGIFSAMFHMTLWKVGQQLDETLENMILISLFHSDNLSLGSTLLHSVLMTGGVFNITAFLFCEVHLISVVIATVRKLRRRILAVDGKVGTLLKKYLILASVIAICAATLWLTERVTCRALNETFPFNPQLHSWWHVLCALALYQTFQIAVALHFCETSEASRVQLHCNSLRLGVVTVKPSKSVL